MIQSINESLSEIAKQGTKQINRQKTAQGKRQVKTEGNCGTSQRSSSICKSIVSNISASMYKAAVHQYKQFLSIFQSRLQNVYEKQNYRIYLSDRTNQKLYRQLIQQKDNLIKQIQESKDYKKSANRQLIQQVMNLQRIKEEYQEKSKQYQLKIKNKRQQLKKNKVLLKKLQEQIKSYWIYNYDVTTKQTNNSIKQTVHISQISSINNTPKPHLNQSTKSNLQLDKQNVKQPPNLTQNKSCLSIHNKNKLNSIHLPLIPNHKHNSNTSNYINKTSLRYPTNYSNYQSIPNIKNHLKYNKQSCQNSQINKSSRITEINKSRINKNDTIIISKQLSLVNSSPTRQKLQQKIQKNNKQKSIERLQYEIQKLNLLKMFKLYLKKSSQLQENYTQRMRLQKMTQQIEQGIKQKQTILKQIQTLLFQ